MRADIVLVAIVGLAPRIHHTEVELGLRVALLGGEAVPFQRLRIILRHAVAFVVHDAESGLGARITLLGQRTQSAF